MSKRFTDTKKWKNSWFRTLPKEAKLAWSYICDECESHGLMKMDYGLASFQLDFILTRNDLIKWFAEKLYHLDSEKFVIVPFFEFQYGESKDSWSAKVTAKKKLELLGFSIENNKLVVPTGQNIPTVVDSPKTVLIRVKGIGIVNSSFNNKEDKTIFNLEEAYNSYRLKKGKSKGLQKLTKDVKSESDYLDLIKSIENYNKDLDINKTEIKYIKHFSTFASEWRDWVNYVPPISTHKGAFENSRADSVSDFEAEIKRVKEMK